MYIRTRERLLVDEVLYTRTYDSERARRTALGIWVNHYNYRRPPYRLRRAAPGHTDHVREVS